MPLETEPEADAPPPDPTTAGTTEDDTDAADEDDRAEYHALELGAGRSVVLIHDLYASHEAFADLTERLAEDWRVVVVDLPGHGRSSRPGGFADIHEVAVELGAVLDEFAAFPAAVVGAGVGATIAVELAAARPDDVTALVLVGAGLGAESAMWTEPAPAAWLAGTGTSSDFVDALMPILYGERFFADQPGRAASERARLASLDPANVAPLALAAAASGDRVDRLEDVPVPALVLAGEDDALVTPERLREVAAHAGVELVTIPWVGHSAVLEGPVSVAATVEGFLRAR